MYFILLSHAHTHTHTHTRTHSLTHTHTHTQASSFSPKDFTGALYCEAPHNKIYDFNGYM